MARAFLCTFLLALTASTAWATSCSIKSTDYAAGDGMVLTDAAYVISFTAECPQNVVPQYAVVDGRTLAVVRGEAIGQYQVSWIKEIGKASSGFYNIAVYDEEGYQQFKKSQRSGSGGATPLATVPFSHSSPYRGPLIQGEFIALAIALFLSYYALVLRFKIVNKKI